LCERIRRGENDPSEALEKEIWAIAYLAHPYHHSTIGWRSDFEKVPIKKLRTFYDTFYWPNNATVTIIGDFEPAAALELVKQHYGKIPKSPQPIPEVYTEEPPQTGARRVTVQRPGELGVVMIAQKIPPATNSDFAALRVLSTILSDGRNSRFYKALTDKSLTTDVSADPEFNRDPSLMFITAQLTPNTKHEDVERLMLAEIARVQKGWRPNRRSCRGDRQVCRRYGLRARWFDGHRVCPQRVHRCGRLEFVLSSRRRRETRYAG